MPGMEVMKECVQIMSVEMSKDYVIIGRYGSPRTLTKSLCRARWSIFPAELQLLHVTVDGSCPYLGQEVTARFSVPHYGPDDSFDMANFVRAGYISRIDDINRFSRRVAINFIEPLPFKPGEQTVNEFDAQEALTSHA